MSALQRARYQPITAQAEVTAKVNFDMSEVQRRKDAPPSNFVYGGSKENVNFTVEPGELVMGMRIRNGAYTRPSPGHEVGLSSLTAFDYTDGATSDEELSRKFYFIGCAKYEDLGPETDFFGDFSGDNGFSAVKSGSYMTYNNNTENIDIAAGDIVCWQLPPNRRGDEAARARPQLDDGYNSINQQNVSTMPWTKTLFHTVPFDPNNFVMQRFGIAAQLDSLSGQTTNWAKPQGNREPLTSLKQEAAAWALGLLQFASLVGAQGADIQNNQFSPANIALLKRAFDSIGNSREPRRDWFDNICRGVTGVWYAKTSRILGKAMGSAKPGQNLPLMFSNFKVGF